MVRLSGFTLATSLVAIWLSTAASTVGCSKDDPPQNTPEATADAGPGPNAGELDAGETPATDAGPAPGADATTPDEDAGPPEMKPLPPASPPDSGALLGAFVGLQTVGASAAGTPEDIANSEKKIGRTWSIDHKFYSIEDWSVATKWAVDHNKIPLITWEPGAWKLDDIIAGKHDAEITSRAENLKSYDVPIYMRWGHEMNGDWYAWSGFANGGAAGGPAKYIAAYKHTHDLFKAAGATKVLWIWCPLVTDVPAAPWNHWTNYYPGDDYVDWVGMDGYNWGSSNSCCKWQSFDTLYKRLYTDYAGKKPIMIPEVGSAEVGGNKAEWIRDMHNHLKTDYSLVRGLVWFHVNKETDWRIDSSPATLQAFKELAQDPWFNPY